MAWHEVVVHKVSARPASNDGSGGRGTRRGVEVGGSSSGRSCPRRIGSVMCCVVVPLVPRLGQKMALNRSNKHPTAKEEQLPATYMRSRSCPSSSGTAVADGAVTVRFTDARAVTVCIAARFSV